MIFILKYLCRTYFTCVVECKIEMTRKCCFLRGVINVTPFYIILKCVKNVILLRHFPKIYIIKFDFFLNVGI